MQYELSRIHLLTAMIVKGWSQTRLAEALALKESKMSRILSGKISPSAIPEDAAACFHYEHDAMDALLPKDPDALVTLKNFDEGEAETVAVLSIVAAEKFAGTVREWPCRRTAAKALLTYGVSCDCDDDEGVTIYLTKKGEPLREARKLFLDLPNLKAVPAAKRDLVRLGSELDAAGVDMLLEKANDSIAPDSQSVTGHEAVFEAVTERLSAVKVGGNVVPVEYSREEVYLRTLLLNCGASLAELYVESGQLDSVPGLVERMIQLLDSDGSHGLHIRQRLILSAWPCNQPALSQSLDMAA